MLKISILDTMLSTSIGSWWFCRLLLCDPLHLLSIKFLKIKYYHSWDSPANFSNLPAQHTALSIWVWKLLIHDPSSISQGPMNWYSELYNNFHSTPDVITWYMHNGQCHMLHFQLYYEDISHKWNVILMTFSLHNLQCGQWQKYQQYDISIDE